MIKLLQTATNFLYDVIAPPFCFYCRDYIYDSDKNNGVNQSSRFLCTSCAQLIKPILSARIALNAQYTLAVHAVSAYENPLKQLILAKNYSDYTASKQLAHIMWQLSMARHIPFDYIVPVPAHWTRVSKRGYNQAQVIAQELGYLSGRPVVPLLKKSQRTKSQVTRKTHERFENVKDSFKLIEGQSSIIDMVENRIVLLIDDLMATGSTLHAAATQLIRTRPKEVYALVACRVV